MILSASRRTDIPAFYSDWFLNRIKDGFLYVRNPMNPKQVSQVNLSPELIDAIVFWTKDPKALMNRLDELDRYKYYFQYTLNAYPQNIESNISHLEDRLDTFLNLSKKIGRDKVIWRYDPVFLTDTIGVKYHKDNFEQISNRLKNHTDTVVISIVDKYRKISKNMDFVKFREFEEEELEELMVFFKKTSETLGLNIQSCSEELDIAKYGIKAGKCIDDVLISKLTGNTINFKKDKNQRVVCGCVESVDIGAYNTCSHQCKYCYANYSNYVVKNNIGKHDKYSPFLIGQSMEGDKITIRKVATVKSIAIQTTFI